MAPTTKKTTSKTSSSKTKDAAKSASGKSVAKKSPKQSAGKSATTKQSGARTPPGNPSPIPKTSSGRKAAASTKSASPKKPPPPGKAMSPKRQSARLIATEQDAAGVPADVRPVNAPQSRAEAAKRESQAFGGAAPGGCARGCAPRRRWSRPTCAS
jgi:hypothetical protein